MAVKNAKRGLGKGLDSLIPAKTSITNLKLKKSILREK